MPHPDAEERRRRIDQSLGSLPSLTKAVLKLFSLDAEADDYPARLGELLESEPSFAAEVLKAANSVLYGSEQPVRTLPEAVVRLGARRAGQLVKAMAMMRLFTPRTAEDFTLWQHSIQVAVATRVFAASLPEMDPNEAYLAGLLHDIGRFVMLNYAPREVRQSEEEGNLTEEDLLALERAHCGYDQCEVGWRACQALSLPSGIGLLVKHHHSILPRIKELSAAQLRLLRAIQQADRLSQLYLDDP